jgi:acyl-CoA thioester hydrolase
VKIRVYYEDTDAGGIVYHTNYIKYCERARSEIFFKEGLMPFDKNGSGFVVRSLEADFLGTAKLGDTLEVKTETLESKRASTLLRQSIFLEGKIIFDMRVLLVYLVDGRVKKIPEELLNLIKQNRV